MPLFAKGIKPARLQDKAFSQTILDALEKAGKTIKDEDYGAITKTWKHKPKIEVVVDLAGPGPTLLVGTDDEIYGYVDEGTRAHVIVPRRAKVLKFKSGYVAKTAPGVIGSTSGGPTGGDVYSAGVIHPGTKAREFEKTIKEKRESWFKKQMEAAMREAAKKSGYGG